MHHRRSPFMTRKPCVGLVKGTTQHTRKTSVCHSVPLAWKNVTPQRLSIQPGRSTSTYQCAGPYCHLGSKGSKRNRTHISRPRGHGTKQALGPLAFAKDIKYGLQLAGTERQEAEHSLQHVSSHPLHGDGGANASIWPNCWPKPSKRCAERSQVRVVRSWENRDAAKGAAASHTIQRRVHCE